MYTPDPEAMKSLLQKSSTYSEIIQRLVRRYLFKLERERKGGQNIIIILCNQLTKIVLTDKVNTSYCLRASCTVTVGIKCIQPPDVFPFTPIVNKSRNIECCVNNMLQIIQNMMFSQSLELELSMFGRTTISG